MDKVREAEIVRIVKEIGGEGRITLTFVDNDGNERPTFLCKELVKRVISLEAADAIGELQREKRHRLLLQKALMFWLPMVPDSPEDVSKRVAHDAYLLMGYEGEEEPSAEGLGWIELLKGDKGNLVSPSKPSDTSLEAVMYQIKEMTDPDDPDSYRNDDPHGCLEVVHIVAVEALASASQGNGGRD